jgi:N-acetylglucosamine-6-phosphate deacetylase
MDVTLRGSVVADGRVIADGVVATSTDTISFVGATHDYPEPPPPRQNVMILPGLIDVHCHGGGGYGFGESGIAGALSARDFHRRAGSTSMLASLVTAPVDKLTERLAELCDLVHSGELAGIHLEGPFLSRMRCGAQNPRYIIDGDPNLLDELLTAGGGGVRSVTLAPETAYFADMARLLHDNGVVVSVGHTDAPPMSTTHAVIDRAGGRLSATHLFNAMAPLLPRQPGTVAACLAAAGRGEMVVELIGDGVHLDPATVSMVFDLVGPHQIALISDAMAAAGMGDGQYTLGTANVTVRNGVARLSERPDDRGEPAIAGGTSTMLDVVRVTVLGGVDIADAVTAASSTPAALLGLCDRGVLRRGLRADLVVTDPELALRRVMVAGKWLT